MRLIEGTRAGPGQSRFGDLTGARHADDKGREAMTHRHPDRKRDLSPQLEHKLKEIAEQWAQAIAKENLSRLLSLYAPMSNCILGSRPWRGSARSTGSSPAVPSGTSAPGPSRSEEPIRRWRSDGAHWSVVQGDPVGESTTVRSWSSGSE